MALPSYAHARVDNLDLDNSRPDMTFPVDWALKTNYLSIYDSHLLLVYGTIQHNARARVDNLDLDARSQWLGRETNSALGYLHS